MLNPYELRVFLAAAEAENFSAAARKLHLTQPAVSQQIQTLEKRLQLELFHRDGKHINLTEAGQALAPMARELVNLSARIEETMAARRGMVTGHLTIGCTSTPGKYTLPWLVGSFCEQYPHVQISVEVVRRADLVHKLERQDINYGIMSGQIEHPDLVYQEFMGSLGIAVTLGQTYVSALGEHAGSPLRVGSITANPNEPIYAG